MFFYAFPGETLGSNPYRYLVGPALQPAEQPQPTRGGRAVSEAAASPATSADSASEVGLGRGVLQRSEAATVTVAVNLVVFQLLEAEEEAGGGGEAQLQRPPGRRRISLSFFQSIFYLVKLHNLWVNHHKISCLI